MKKKIILIGSEGLIGSTFQNYLLKSETNLICVDIKKKKNFYNDIIYVRENINSPASLKKIINIAKKKIGLITHVIDCSYPKIILKRKKNLKNYEYEVLKKNISENISRNIMICEIFGEYFKGNKISGNVVMINSIQGIMAPKFEHYKNTSMSSPVEYTALKFSLTGIIKYFAKVYGKYSINFNCISPGGIKNNQNQNFLKNYKKSCLSKGMLDAIDLNTALEFLINQKSKMVNGQNIIVDDGWTL